MVCWTLATVTFWVVSEAAIQSALPGCEAMISQASAPMKLTTLPLTVHTPVSSMWMAKLTGRPELAVAVTV